MQDYMQYQPAGGHSQPRSPAWIWALIALAFLFGLPCAGVVAWLIYIGAAGPDTAIYTGNQVPSRFVATMKDVGALAEDETILYFYSDAMSDIRDGFYFVSDKKVGIYSETAGQTPLITVDFDEIAELYLDRNESFFIDSQITLELKDGRMVSFPVSSEVDRDERFFESIQSRVSRSDDNAPEAGAALPATVPNEQAA